MALRSYTYGATGTVRLELSDCPFCGHRFKPREQRYRHVLEEHEPADVGLSPDRGEFPGR